jgi:hypothetical protein
MPREITYLMEQMMGNGICEIHVDPKKVEVAKQDVKSG